MLLNLAEFCEYAGLSNFRIDYDSNTIYVYKQQDIYRLLNIMSKEMIIEGAPKINVVVTDKA